MDSLKLPELRLPLKPVYKKIGEDPDFFELFKKIEKEKENCFLMESLGEESYTSRYSIIGFDPEYIISARKKRLTLKGAGKVYEIECENPFYMLRKIIPQNILSHRFCGGLVGSLGYDSINYFESSLSVKSHKDFEPFQFGLYTDGLLYDKMTGEVFYFYYTKDRSGEFDFLKTAPVKEGPLVVSFEGDSSSREEHKEAVLKVKEDIRNGLIFQCEVGFKSFYKINGDTLNIYKRLREVNPSPHMFYVKFGDRKFIGASPELLFRLRQGEMETFPLAGTARRGKDAEEDLRLARALLNDPKEIAEHNMLVDLHRNDLGRVARFGSVKVRSLMDIKRYSHVQHISSEIVGLLGKKEDMFSALAANFPAGTLSGAPKIEAMKIIDSLEAEGRGPYGGGIGHFEFNGNCTFAIPIRSLFIKGNKGYIQTSGGNVYDSQPEAEYEEIQRKLGAMKNVLKEFEK